MPALFSTRNLMPASHRFFEQGISTPHWLWRPDSPRPGWSRFLTQIRSRDATRFEEWVKAGRAGTMRYLERTGEDGRLLRSRVGISVSLGALGSGLLCNLQQPAAAPRLSLLPRLGLDCRYAWSSKVDEEGNRRPTDYHKVLLKRMKKAGVASARATRRLHGTRFCGQPVR